MANYPFLKNLLISIFSVDVGLEENSEIATLERILSNPSQKLKIEEELKRLFQDTTISWPDLLDNDEYVVYPADNEDDAKKYIIDNLWRKVFPHNQTP